MRRLSLLAVFALAVLGVAQEGLPEDEQGLFQYAAARANHQQWREADRVFVLFLERFPESKLAEQAHFRLGQLHVHHSKRFDEGRTWLEKLTPEGDHFWPARFLIAQSYAMQQKKEQAIEEYRRILRECEDPNQKTAAGDQVLSLKGKHFQPYVSQTYTVGETPKVQFQVRNVTEAEMRLYRIPWEELVEHFRPEDPSLREAIAKVDPKRRALVKEWREYFRQPEGQWSNKNVELPELESGLYVLLAAHDEITKSVVVVVNEYGFIVKAEGARVLVFAQHRTTGEPVEGMTIRSYEGGKVREGRTDADGLHIVEGAAQGAFLLGIKDGEYSFATAWSSGYAGQESLFQFVTDRPIYRPNQRVLWKLLHRVKDGERLEARPGLKAKVIIRDPRNNVVYEGEHALNRFGSCHGELLLGGQPPLGVYGMEFQALEAVPGNQRWWQSQGRFRVDEYRKPEYEVDVAFGKERYVQGDTLEATIAASYYFGSPVPHASVRYRILRNAHYVWWGPRYEWYGWYATEDTGFYYGGGQEVYSGSGVTDENGKLDVRFAIPRWEHDANYTLVADAVDLSRRQVSGSGSVLATRAEIGLSIELDKYLYRPDEKMAVRLAARFHDGTPANNQVLRLTASQRTWKRGKHRDREFFEAMAQTDERGEATIPVGIDREGSLHLRVQARDARGNDVDATRYVWVASPDWQGSAMSWQGVDVVADKASYKPGEKATFLLSSEVKDLHLLFTLEGDRIFHHQVVRMNGHTATVEVEITKALAPTAFAALAALHGNGMQQRYRPIVVDPRDRFLTVELKTDRKQYKPGDPATVEITTRDKGGNPVAAEVALGVVDESIYALQKEFAEDIRKAFVPPVWNRVRTGSTLQFWDYGQAVEEELEAAGDDAGVVFESRAEAKAPGRGIAGGAEALVQPEVRRNFADTMYWSPAVVTDEAGKATVRIDEVADNLTTWRLTARAMGLGGLVGQEKTSVVVRKDLIVRLQTPRFFTQGDRATVSAVVHNYLDNPKTVEVRIEAKGVGLRGETTLRSEIGSQEEKRFDWPATITDPGTATVTVKALTNEESDAMELLVPVLPHGSLQWKSSGGIVTDEVNETFTVPSDAIEKATELLVVVSPTHAATVLDALDYLADYPYGCVEQTMSRFLPSTITRNVLRNLKIEKPWLEEQLPDMIQAGLQRLYDFQHSDGGWGWWRNDDTNPFMTAYVVYGLALAREADVPVDPNVLQRGLAALRAHLEKAEDPEERVYLLHALSAAGGRADGIRNAVADGLNTLPPASKAMLALVLAKDGEREEAKRVLGALAEDALDVGATAHWRASKEYRWTGHATEATALALRAFLAIEPNHPLVAKIVTWLALNREGNRWVSTRQTAMVVFAMSEYIALTGDLAPDMTLTLELNGERVWERRVTKDNWQEFEGTTKLLGDRIRPGDNTVTIRRTGQGNPVYSVFLKHFRRAERFEPSTGGLRVEREYFLVKAVGGKRELEPLGDGATVRSGDEVEVKLTVRADRPYRYLIVEDPMPAGFEAVREYQERPFYGRWDWWYANKEFRDEKVEVAVTHLPEGEQNVTYVMRAETPGAFKVLPAVVWNMYQPGEGGNSAGRSISVEE